MVDRIGQGSSLARAAIEAALARHAEATRKAAAHPPPSVALASAASTTPKQAASAAQTAAASAAQALDGAPAPDFAQSLGEGIRAIDAEVRRADRLATDVVTGKITDFHEAAALLKQSELSLKFALEVRNKFIDAYREIMRMSV